MLNLISPTELEKRKDAQGCVVFRGEELGKACEEMIELWPEQMGGINAEKLRSFTVLRAQYHEAKRRWTWSGE